MATILRTAFSNSFPFTQSFVSWLEFHSILFNQQQTSIGADKCLALRQATTWNYYCLVRWHVYAWNSIENSSDPHINVGNTIAMKFCRWYESRDMCISNLYISLKCSYIKRNCHQIGINVTEINRVPFWRPLCLSNAFETTPSGLYVRSIFTYAFLCLKCIIIWKYFTSSLKVCISVMCENQRCISRRLTFLIERKYRIPPGNLMRTWHLSRSKSHDWISPHLDVIMLTNCCNYSSRHNDVKTCRHCDFRIECILEFSFKLYTIADNFFFCCLPDGISLKKRTITYRYIFPHYCIMMLLISFAVCLWFNLCDLTWGSPGCQSRSL